MSSTTVGILQIFILTTTRKGSYSHYFPILQRKETVNTKQLTPVTRLMRGEPGMCGKDPNFSLSQGRDRAVSKTCVKGFMTQNVRSVQMP